jgi:hypothetical protein
VFYAFQPSIGFLGWLLRKGCKRWPEMNVLDNFVLNLDNPTIRIMTLLKKTLLIMTLLKKTLLIMTILIILNTSDITFN